MSIAKKLNLKRVMTLRTPNRPADVDLGDVVWART